MFLIDRLLLAPARGLMWIFREVHAAAEEEQQATQGRLLQSLSELHRQLERGEIDEAGFAAREQELLTRLEAQQQGRSTTA